MTDSHDELSKAGRRKKTNTRSITLLEPETKARYTRLKNESQRRQGDTELVNDEFMAQLLEVYEYHLSEAYEYGEK